MQFLTRHKNIKETSHPETVIIYTLHPRYMSQIVMSYIPCAYKRQFEEIEESKSTKNVLLKIILGHYVRKVQKFLLSVRSKNEECLTIVRSQTNMHKLDFCIIIMFCVLNAVSNAHQESLL